MAYRLDKHNHTCKTNSPFHTIALLTRRLRPPLPLVGGLGGLRGKKNMSRKQMKSASCMRRGSSITKRRKHETAVHLVKCFLCESPLYTPRCKVTSRPDCKLVFFLKKNTCLFRFRRKHLTEVKSKIDTGGGGGGTGGGGGGSGGNSRANSKKVRGSVKSNKKKKPPNLNNLVRGKEN